MALDNVPSNLEFKVTQPAIASYKFEWTISNFTSKAMSKNLLKSPSFYVGANDSVEWNLCAYTNGYNKDNEGYMSMMLCLLSSYDSSILLKYQLCIINAKKCRVNNRNDQTFHIITLGSGHLKHKFIKRDDLLNKANGFLTDNDDFTIECSIQVLESCKRQWLGIQLPDHFKHVLSTKKFTDVTLVVENKKFQAHKLILAARSPAFAAMFTGCMKNNKQSLINITDIKPNVFEAVLNFIYTDNVTNLYGDAEDLLVAAEKYDLKRLKLMCEKALCIKLRFCNTIKILILADRYKIDPLKKVAIDYICLQAKKVMEEVEFKLLTKDHPDLFMEIFQALANKKLPLPTK